MQYYFGNIIEFDAGHGIALPYSVRENAPLDATSLIVKLINPDGSMEPTQQVILLGSERPFIYQDLLEYQSAVRFEKAVRRMFSGL